MSRHGADTQVRQDVHFLLCAYVNSHGPVSVTLRRTNLAKGDDMASSIYTRLSYSEGATSLHQEAAQYLRLVQKQYKRKYYRRV